MTCYAGEPHVLEKISSHISIVDMGSRGHLSHELVSIDGPRVVKDI